MRPSATVVLTAAALLGACGSGDEASAPSTTRPVIEVQDAAATTPPTEPSGYVERVDNPYFPLLPGSRWLYRGTEDGERVEIEVTVTDDRRTVNGISAVVVHDVVKANGEVVENTYDWYAQDRDGTVWYVGEDSSEIEDGKVVSKHGSWEAGVDGATAGIAMPAAPKPGATYRQELYPGEAEDMAEVVRLDGSTAVPFGRFDGLLVIKEWNPLEPKVVEEKYYAKGVGAVLEVVIAGGKGRVELVEHRVGGTT